MLMNGKSCLIPLLYGKQHNVDMYNSLNTTVHMGMFKNNEAFHFFASHAYICHNVTEQAWLKDVFWSLCSSYKILFKSNK